MLEIWNFAHILTEAVYISWWGLKVRMVNFAKWWGKCNTSCSEMMCVYDVQFQRKLRRNSEASTGFETMTSALHRYHGTWFESSWSQNFFWAFFATALVASWLQEFISTITSYSIHLYVLQFYYCTCCSGLDGSWSCKKNTIFKRNFFL